MKIDFSRIELRHQAVVGALIVLSTLAVLLMPSLADTAEAQTCPPGWSSCEAWTDDSGACCGGPFNRQVIKRVCTEWGPDSTAYPNCTYKVIWRETVYACDWSRSCL